MSAGTQTARSAPLPLVAANEDRAKNARFPVDFQDLCSLAMDQALGIEKASLSTVVSLEFMRTRYLSGSSAVQPRIRQSFRPDGSSGGLLYRIANELAHPVGPTFLSHLAAAASQSQPTEKDLAHSTDIAIGGSRAVTSISGGHAQRKARADVSEPSMDIAIGSRAA